MTNSARAAQFTEPGQGLVPGLRVLAADGAMGTIAFHPEARYFSA